MLRPNREKPEFIPFSLAVFSLPCQGNVGIGECVSGIYTWSLTVVGIVAFVQIFYAGWLYLTAAGNIAKTSQAMSKISNAILGIVLLFSSYLILNTINPDLVGNDFNLPNLRGNEVEKVNYENNSNFSPTTIITTTTVLPTDSTTTTRSPDSGTTTTTTRSGGSGNENVGGRGSVSSPCEGMDEQLRKMERGAIA